VSLPGGDDQDSDDSYVRKKKSKKKKKRDVSSSASDDSLSEESYLSPTGSTASKSRPRESKWRSHDAGAESGAESSGSESGLPQGFGELGVKELVKKSNKGKKSKQSTWKDSSSLSMEYGGGSSGDDVSSSRRPHVAGSDDESVSTAHSGGGTDTRRGKGGVRYQVRVMADGSTKRVEVRDNEDLFDQDDRESVRSGGGRRRHKLDAVAPKDTHAQSQPQKKVAEENLLEKAERLQREARVMREAAEHARRQEALREMAEREKHKAQKQVEDLQRQLEEARSGKAAEIEKQIMKVRMGPEASGDDELNAYLMRSSKVPKQQLQAQQASDDAPCINDDGAADAPASNKKRDRGDERRSQIKTSPPAGQSHDSQSGVVSSSTLPARGGGASAFAESRATTAATTAMSHIPSESSHRQTRASRPGTRADEDWDEEEEELPIELLDRLHSVAASLIQQSWRKTRATPAASKCQPVAPRCSTQLSSTGPVKSQLMNASAKATDLLASTTGVGGGPAATGAMSGATPATPAPATALGMGTGKGRSSTAHTMLGASATGAAQVPPTIKALQLALARSGLENGVEAFVWLDRAGKNSLSTSVLAHGLKTLCATNIDAGQLTFDLNPQSPDGRVSVQEFVTALQFAATGVQATASGTGGATLLQQVSAARAALQDLTTRVHHSLHRSVMSKTVPSSLSCTTQPAYDTTLAHTASISSTSFAHATTHSEDAQERENKQQNKANVLRDARVLFKKRGFQNVAELFLFVQTCSPTDPGDAPANGTESVTCRQLIKALKALHLSNEVVGKDLVYAMGKKSPSDFLSYRDFVQHVAWECAGLAADAWNPKTALDAGFSLSLSLSPPPHTHPRTNVFSLVPSLCLTHTHFSCACALFA
jgi:hypothetical protein